MALRKTKIDGFKSNHTFTHKVTPVVEKENMLAPVSEQVQTPTMEQVPTPSIEPEKNNTSWMDAFEEIKPSQSISTKGAALSIVNSKNGKRVKLSNPIIEELDSPQHVRILINEDQREVYILVSEAHANAHNLTGNSSKNTLYSASLVERLTTLFALDYSTRTSHSIGTWTVTEKEGTKVICVRHHEEIKKELNGVQDETGQFME